MIDELDSLRGVRADVAPPAEHARNEAWARWQSTVLAPAPTTSPRRRGAQTFGARVAIAAVLSAALIAALLAVTRQRIDSVKPRHEVDVASLVPTGHGEPQVFLFLGLDQSASPESNERADTIMLLRVDPSTRRVLAVSIPRDLWVDVPGCGPQRMSAAYALTCGGRTRFELVVATITESLHVPVNHVVVVKFDQFESLVDAVGGVRVQFPTAARDRYSGLAAAPGCHLLMGEQALAFVRSRHYEFAVDGEWREDPRSDLARVARQQLTLRQLAIAADARAGTDPRPFLRLLFDHVTVDADFTPDDAIRLFGALRGGPPAVTMTVPASQAVKGGQAVLVPAGDADDVLGSVAGRDGAGVAAGGSPPSFEPTAC